MAATAGILARVSDEPEPVDASESRALAVSEPPPTAEPPALVPAAAGSRLVDRLDAWSRSPTPLPAADDRRLHFAWGVAQPLLGLRLLFARRELLLRAIGPVLGFLGVCVLVAGGEDGLPWYAVYYLTLISAAPLSPVVFSRHYARLASAARRHVELPPSEPYLRSGRQILGEAFVQLLVVGVGIAPLAGLVAMVPLLGPMWAALLGYLWALHWIVVEALDAAKCSSELEREPLHADHLPWFARPARWRTQGLQRVLSWPLRAWSSLLRRMSLRWRSEIALIEQHPAMALGFGLGSALLLAVPLLNLVFRPAIVIAATHVWARASDPAPTQVLPENLA